MTTLGAKRGGESSSTSTGEIRLLMLKSPATGAWSDGYLVGGLSLQMRGAIGEL